MTKAKRIIMMAKTADNVKITVNVNMYHGGYNEHNKRIIKQAIEEIQQTIAQQTIYHNDITTKLWCFDYKLPCGIWCENITFKNDLRSGKCLICI